MEKEQRIVFTVACKKCGKEYDLSKSIGKLPCMTDEPIGIESKKMLLTYSECPHCGNIHLSQLDDEQTQAMTKELHRLILRKIAFEKKGRKMKRKEHRKAIELDKDLNLKRAELKLAYNGKKLLHCLKTDKIDNVFVFEYSEPKLVAKDIIDESGE